jgi:hypothetical protein
MPAIDNCIKILGTLACQSQCCSNILAWPCPGMSKIALWLLEYFGSVQSALSLQIDLNYPVFRSGETEREEDSKKSL